MQDGQETRSSSNRSALLCASGIQHLLQSINLAVLKVSSWWPWTAVSSLGDSSLPFCGRNPIKQPLAQAQRVRGWTLTAQPKKAAQTSGSSATSEHAHRMGLLPRNTPGPSAARNISLAAPPPQHITLTQIPALLSQQLTLY